MTSYVKLGQGAGLQFDFSPDRTVITGTNLEDVPELAGLGLKQHTITELQDRAETIAELAANLNSTDDAIRKRVKRHERKAFVLLPGNA